MWALQSPELFSSKAFKEMMQPEGLKTECPRDLFIVSQDGEKHKKNRALMSEAFSAKVIHNLIPKIQTAAEEMAKKLPVSEEVSFIDHFAYPYISTITDQITGVDNGLSQDEIGIWLNNLHQSMSQHYDEKKLEEIEESIVEQNKKFLNIIEEKRQNPANDLISKLVHAEVDSQLLSKTDLLNAIELVYVVGFYGQIQVLCRAMQYLSEKPDLLTELKANHDSIPIFVEELLRHSLLAPGVMRKTTQEIIRHGVKIPKNSTVLCLIASANKDPSVFPNPERFDLLRPNLKKQLVFGAGPHLCSGATLARHQLTIGIEVILSRFSKIECPPSSTINKDTSWMAHTILDLPITFS